MLVFFVRNPDFTQKEKKINFFLRVRGVLRYIVCSDSMLFKKYTHKNIYQKIHIKRYTTKIHTKKYLPKNTHQTIITKKYSPNNTHQKILKIHTKKYSPKNTHQKIHTKKYTQKHVFSFKKTTVRRVHEKNEKKRFHPFL